METFTKNKELLFDKVEKYTNTSINLIKLKTVEKSADLISTVTSGIVILILFVMFTLFVNIGVGLFIGKLLKEYYLGFLIVSIFYLIIGVIFYYTKNKLLKIPLTNLIISKLIGTTELDKILKDNKYSSHESTHSNSKTYNS